MIATLEFMKADLSLSVSTLSMHLRNRAYKLGTPAHQNALQSLIFNVMICDELTILLERYSKLKAELKRYAAGEWEPMVGQEQDDIYQSCLYAFEGDQCPLGIASAELQSWVSSLADRNQQMREGLEMLFPDVEFKILDELMESDFIEQDLTDTERFENKTANLLRDIEESNALTDFNGHLLQVKAMLQRKEPVSIILQTFPVDDE